jgi:ABC-2 type transport system permease protein
VSVAPSTVTGIRPGGLSYYMRVLRVAAAIDFKALYAGSVLGSAWSLAKPLAYFGVLWLVFAHLLRTANETRHFSVFLLLGVILYTFFVDAIQEMLPSIVSRGGILRRLAFPPILIPLSASITVLITFSVNIVAVIVYIAIAKITPEPSLLLVVPLLVELYVLIIGLGLLLSTLYVRLRDIGQIWQLAAQLLFFASAIMYPIGILPLWAQRIAFLNPFVQVMQDIRHAVLGGSSGPHDVDAGSVYAGAGGRIWPVLVTLLVFGIGLMVFRRESRYFAERI